MDPQQTPERPDIVTPPSPTEAPPQGWLQKNGPGLVVLAALVTLLFSWLGAEGVWNVTKVILGLGAVIFIHELGHFLAAKWCDVHTPTFGIGFPLPDLQGSGPLTQVYRRVFGFLTRPIYSFQRGETTYKLNWLPLGGYVRMVGENMGEDEEEDKQAAEDPRSFKNKTVGQRMIIISAGVAMNVLMAVVCFIVALKSGVHMTAAVIGPTEAGGPAWVHGMRPGDVLESVDDISNPVFEDLKIRVVLSGENEPVTFVVRRPGEEPRTIAIVARKSKNDPNPVIGVGNPLEMTLAPKEAFSDGRTVPARRGSPAAVARVLDLRPGDTVLQASDPANPEKLTELVGPGAQEGDHYARLADRLAPLAGQPMKLRVRRASGSEEVIDVPAVGFQFEDAIVGTTDPDGRDPFQVKPLPSDPRDPQGRHLDYFEYLRRMHRLADRPVVIQVRRKDAPADAPPVSVFVPPEYQRTLGLRMEIGPVAAVRLRSSADKKVEPGDVIRRIELSDGKDSIAFALNPDTTRGEKVLDPLRLPHELRRWARDRDKVTASLKVKREDPVAKEGDAGREFTNLEWDKSREFDEELPLGLNSPVAISELGIAYLVQTTVAGVDPGSSAAEKGLQPGDLVLEVRRQHPVGQPRLTQRLRGLFGDKPPEPGTPQWDKNSLELWSKDESLGDPQQRKAEPRWARVSMLLHNSEYPDVRLLVKPASGREAEWVELSLRPDHTWPVVDPFAVRGLEMLMRQNRIVKADSLAEAVGMGMNHTSRLLMSTYMGLRSMLTRRVSAKDNLAGPLGIAVTAYTVADASWPDFVFFVGFISVNLAVVNFLPIPILDGGHMVFLIYEKLRGRPASEAVRHAANLLGLLVLLGLVVFAFYIDFVKYVL